MLEAHGRRVALAYLLVLATLCATFVLAIRLAGASALWLAQPYMLTPAIAAAVVRATVDEGGFRDARFGLGRARDWVRFWGLSIGVIAAAEALGTALGALEWDPTGETFLRRLSDQMKAAGQDVNDLPAGLTPKHMLVIFFAGGLTVFDVLPGLVNGLGEELGWRGLLFPRLYELRPSLAVVGGGFAWFLWHLPLALVLPIPLPDTGALGLALLALLGAVGSVAANTFFAWVYARSGSIWVASLAHIAHNNAAMSFSLIATVTSPARMAAAIVLVETALVLWLHRTGELEVLERLRAPAGFRQNVSRPC